MRYSSQTAQPDDVEDAGNQPGSRSSKLEARSSKLEADAVVSGDGMSLIEGGDGVGVDEGGTPTLWRQPPAPRSS
jgi:hypothetical protein